MSNYFAKTNPVVVWVRRIAPFALTALFLVSFASAVSVFSESAVSEQKKNLETALRKGIMECYALEGCYPESLNYLLCSYPVYYDTDTFFIDYQIIGQNIYPAVSVIVKR